MQRMRLLILLLALPLSTWAAQTDSAQSAPRSKSGTPSLPAAATDPSNALHTEVNQLRAAVAEQGRQIEFQKGALEAYAKKSNGSSTAIYAAVLAAIIGGIFAVRNQNRQATQERLLKAVELIMDSNSGYQAEIRRRNLAVFLDGETNKYLEGIKKEFSGSEFTDLHVALAQAMSEKVSTPVEVLEVWRCVLKGKEFFEKVEYPRAEKKET